MACIRTHLISGASAVSLVPRPEDRTRLLSSSLRSFSGPAQLSVSLLTVPECWAGAGNKATLVSRDYISSCTSSKPCFLLWPGLTQPRCLRGHFENTIVPYRRPPKPHFENFNINYPLDLHGCEKYKCTILQLPSTMVTR